VFEYKRANYHQYGKKKQRFPNKRLIVIFNNQDIGIGIFDVKDTKTQMQGAQG